MASESVAVRRIEWLEIIPALRLVGAVRVALTPSVFLLALLGVTLHYLGSLLLDYLLGVEDSSYRRQLFDGGHPAFPFHFSNWNTIPEPLYWVQQKTSGIVASPLMETVTWRGCVAWLLGFLWTLVVWAPIGGTIARYSILRLGAQQDSDILACALFVKSRLLSFLTAPLYPLLGVTVLVIPLAIAGLIMRADIGLLLVGALWIFVLLLGILITWLLLGLIFGWPLMWPAIAAEQAGDTFDAFSRSYSYVFGRPVHYFFYLAVAAIIGIFTMMLVTFATDMVLATSAWGIGLGAGEERMAILNVAAPQYGIVRQPLSISTENGSVFWLGACLIYLWTSAIRAIPIAFAFAYFFAVWSGIYLLLRKDVDDKELDDVFHEDDEARFAAGRRAVAIGATSASVPATEEAE